MRLPRHQRERRDQREQRPARGRPRTDATTDHSADQHRRERAAEALKAVVDRFDAEQLPLNPSRYVIDAMAAVLARLVAEGRLREDAVQAEVMEREATLLRAAFARALQQREEAAPRTR